jgi:hypothetical protein
MFSREFDNLKATLGSLTVNLRDGDWFETDYTVFKTCGPFVIILLDQRVSKF